jgi:hypothetical protein
MKKHVSAILLRFNRYGFLERYFGMGQRRVDTIQRPTIPRVMTGILSIIFMIPERFSVDSKTERGQRGQKSPARTAFRKSLSIALGGWACSSISDDWLRDLFGSRNYTCFCSTCSCCCSFSPSSLRNTHVTWTQLRLSSSKFEAVTVVDRKTPFWNIESICVRGRHSQPS